ARLRIDLKPLEPEQVSDGRSGCFPWVRRLEQGFGPGLRNGEGLAEGIGQGAAVEIGESRADAECVRTNGEGDRALERVAIVPQGPGCGGAIDMNRACCCEIGLLGKLDLEVAVAQGDALELDRLRVLQDGVVRRPREGELVVPARLVQELVLESRRRDRQADLCL